MRSCRSCVTHASGDALTKRLDETFKRYRAWDRLQPLGRLLLDQYSAAHKIDKREREKYEKARDAALPAAFDLGALARWHLCYLANAEAMSDLASRKKARARALKLQRKIAARSRGRPRIRSETGSATLSEVQAASIYGDQQISSAKEAKPRITKRI